MTTQILVPVHTYPDGNSDGLADHAIHVARHLGADLDALVLEPDFPPVSTPFGTMIVNVQEMMAKAKARSRTHAEGLLNRLETANATHTATVTEASAFAIGEEAAARGRYYDLILTGLNADDPMLRATAETMIFGSGRPVLLTPEDKAPISLDHVMIAWDGSRVAARAAHDARPFVKRASKVTVISVVDEKALSTEAPGDVFAQRLKASGVNADFAAIHANGRPIDEALQAHALSSGAGLLVMGGFGHSRMRDFVLGGATRGVLKTLTLPVLISH